MLSRLFIASLWSTAEKGLTSWLLFVMFNCVFVTFLCGILGQVWYLIVSISDFAAFLTYRYHKIQKAFSKLYHRHSELIVKYNIG